MNRPPPQGVVLSRGQRLERLAAAILVSLALGAARFLPPQRPLPFDACLLHRLTGLPCITCGLTRAVCLFAQGKWRDSLLMHPAGWLAFAALAAAMLWTGAEAFASRAFYPQLRSRLLAGVLWCGGVASAVAWTVRLALR